MAADKYAKLKEYALTKLKSRIRGGEPEGCSGFYVKLPYGVGVKIYSTEATTIKGLSRIYGWKEANNAFKMMRKAKGTGCVPKVYCIAPVKLGPKRYAIGLFMEHIGGYHPDDCDYEKLDNILAKAKLYHGDLGTHNVKVYKGKTYILDFDFVKTRTRNNRGYNW